MSLLPAKDSHPLHSRGGLDKGDVSVNGSDETTRLLSRHTTGTLSPPTHYVQVDDYDDKASSVTSASVKRYVSRQGSNVSSRYTGSTHRTGGLQKDDRGSTHSQPPKILVSRHGTSYSTKFAHYYGGLQKDEDAPSETGSILMEIKDTEQHIDGDQQVAAIIYRLFSNPHYDHQHPKTIPELAPEKRGKRHRNPILWSINQFRHWWKTSRLLVRLSGSYGWCQDTVTWTFMATLDVTTKKGAKQALKQMKRIGRGGPNRVFLMNVHPFTRTLRIFIACARAWEARVDNRFYEVGIAEAMAFLGNRCFRYWARHITDWTSAAIAFPISGRFIAPYIEQQSRPVILIMGLIRAVLPFMSSYMGSAFGRQLTFAAYRAANYRWKPVQSIFNFHEDRGVYQDIEDDEELVDFARDIAVSLGHDSNPVNNLAALQSLGFEIMGTGSGGLSYYRKRCEDARKFISLYITPYGPSILNEMPRYIILARRFRPYSALNMWDASDANIFDAAIPPEAEIQGFTYSGAYFTSQEWAALKNRYVEELASYNNACKIMGTPRSHIDSTKLQHNEIAFPPTDLITLKAFIRTGHTGKKRRKEKRRWKQVQASVQKLVNSIEKYKAKCVAPNGVILYFDGLDCSGKSSTGGLICDALEKSGYTVSLVQYNRPPTEEEKKRPWMDRFETPLEDTASKNDTYAALVWDRGPAGDFGMYSWVKALLPHVATHITNFPCTLVISQSMVTSTSCPSQANLIITKSSASLILNASREASSSASCSLSRTRTRLLRHLASVLPTRR